ncbi:MAG: UDP-3-O-[3-hydroxymyristoyl] N-acetylglucosamine deacetylase [Lysobacterales bacterium]|jgi:UDP-3-O-[3-hydroxymyristoyl] N-acetylglucosamine deacetylase/3-hydroxyacyl-[acyl-carrier-protein] dehydratase
MLVKQKTIKSDIKISGVGLHTGNAIDIVLKPAAENTGINFTRVDLDTKPVIKACPESVSDHSELPRCTSIGVDGVYIHTVEHLMSALCGLGVTNVLIEINGNELPGLDGSSKEYVDNIKAVGVSEQNADAEVYSITEPIGVEENGSAIYIFPNDNLSINYTLSYTHPLLHGQYFSTEITQDIYEADIAPCRTFCLESEANELKKMGLGKGANYQNTLVMGDKGVLDNELRFENECARHKVLDFIGDLYLLGMPIRGRVYATKSGHKLNFKLLNKIYKQYLESKEKGIVLGYTYGDKKEIDISGIMKVLPHRYPFLLVDRVVEIEKGKSAVGIKNITINDGFFQGHFPTKPVMPGVLMVEAMAQTAGVVILTNEHHHGKVAFFMAINNVKFRKVVTPGDQLLMEVTIIRDKSKTATVHGVATVDGNVVAEADMMFSFTSSTYLD